MTKSKEKEQICNNKCLWLLLVFRWMKQAVWQHIKDEAHHRAEYLTSTRLLTRTRNNNPNACLCPSPLSVLPTDSGKTLTFFNHDFKGEFQTVTFEGNEIKKLFHGSFHKVNLCLRKCQSRGFITATFTQNVTITSSTCIRHNLVKCD